MRIHTNFGNFRTDVGVAGYKLKSFGRSEFTPPPPPPPPPHMLRASLDCVDGLVVVNQRFNSHSFKYQSTIAI